MSPETLKDLKQYALWLNRIRSRNRWLKSFSYLLLYRLLIPLLHGFLLLRIPFIRKIKTRGVDILVLGNCADDIQSSASIWEILKKSGVKLHITYLRRKTDYLRYAARVKPLPSAPSVMFLYACFARYIVQKWRPRVVCLYASYDTLPSLLRREMNGIGKTVYMAHAVIPTTYLFTSIDYDYYFLFGESSLMNLQRQRVLMGETRVVKTGSTRVRADDVLEPGRPSDVFLYFSNWLVGEKEDYTADFEIVYRWAENHPENKLLIKLHPIEENGYVINRCRNLSNTEVLPANITVKDAISRACLIISSFSSAMVEAAMMNRPCVVVNSRPFDPDSEDVKISDKLLYLERFFMPRATTGAELEDRIRQTLDNYDHAVEQCRHFVRFHFEHTTGSAEFIAQKITEILNGRVPQSAIVLKPQNRKGFT